MIKTFFIIAFICILVSLGFALYALVKQKDDEQSQKIYKALKIRIMLSVLLFVLLFFAVATGVIQPNGIGTQMQLQKQLKLEQQNQQHSLSKP